MHISTLELADNHIQAGGAQCLMEMLRVNFTIQHLVSQIFLKKSSTRGHHSFSSSTGQALNQLLSAVGFVQQSPVGRGS